MLEHVSSVHSRGCVQAAVSPRLNWCEAYSQQNVASLMAPSTDHLQDTLKPSSTRLPGSAQLKEGDGAADRPRSSPVKRQCRSCAAQAGMSSHVASNVLGTLGAVFWSIQLLPQIWVNYRRESHTEGLQPSMMLLWATAAIPLGIYNILSQKSIALQIQAQILASLSLITWGQVYYYGHGWSLARTCLVTSLLAALGAGLELLGILPFLHLREDGKAPHTYLQTMAGLSAAGLGLGVLRHYYDIYQHRSVRGISFLFVFLDAAGDLTSLLSIVIVQPVDIEGVTIYAVELALWIGILFLGAIFNLRAYIIERYGKTDSGSMPRSNIASSGPAVDNASIRSSTSASSVFRTASSGRLATDALELRRRRVDVGA